MEVSSFAFEQELQSRGYDLVIGVDEAGRGPLAGPVVACAASLSNQKLVNSNWGKEDPDYELLITNYSQIKDSKLLSEKQRESLYDFILENFYVGIGVCDHRTIDRINILEATYLAMKKAIASLSRNMEHKTWNKSVILVDGNKIIPNCSYEQKAIVGGDKLIKSISAASIVAKVTRDRLMRGMHEKYPQYCFDKHKGYGTKAHVAALKKYGACEIHRKTFEPIKSLILSGN